MKKLFWFMIVITVALTSCSKDINETEEKTEELNSKSVHAKYELYTCWLYEMQGGVIVPIVGQQCSESINSTCMQPYSCIPIVAYLKELALSRIPKLNEHNWGGHFSLSRDHDVALAFWAMDPSTFIHPDSMVFITPPAHH